MRGRAPLAPRRAPCRPPRGGVALFTSRLLSTHANDPGELDALVEDEPFALFLEPPSLDDRIVNQAAVLSVIADPQLQMDEWLAEHPDTCRALRITAELKREARRRLDQASITERLVIPGLDGLTRYYSPHTRSEEKQHRDGLLPDEPVVGSDPTS
jgi:hypothetical protein